MKEKILQVRDKAMEFYKKHEEACEIAAIVTLDVIQVGVVLYLGGLIGKELGYSRGYKVGYHDGRCEVLDSICNSGDEGEVWSYIDQHNNKIRYVFKAIRK